MKLNSIKVYLSTYLPYFFVFIISLYRPWDADLGWHLNYGEYFFQNWRILKENIFSTEMTNFIWPNTSWGIDLIYYLAFHYLGFLGLTLIGAFCITFTFVFFSKAFNLTYWQKAISFPLLVFFEQPVNEISFRGQLLSITLLSILVYLLERYKQYESRKYLYFIVPLFLFWANLHGQFILGLAIFLLWSFFYLSWKVVQSFRFSKNFFSSLYESILNNSKEIKFFLIVVCITILATLIHPYGIGIYTDAFLHLLSGDLQYITEYLPFEELSGPWWTQMIFGILMLFGVFYLFFDNKIKDKFPEIGTVSILYGLSWWVRRYAWSMYYLGIPLLKPIADFVKPDTDKATHRAATFLFLIYLLTALYLRYPLSQFIDMNWNIYCQNYLSCSPKAIEYIRDNNLKANLLNLYGWGGYMIWNYPDIKPSIDGRMHLWKNESGTSAFSEYYAFEQNWEDINDSKYNTVLINLEKPLYSRLNELVMQGKWIKKYEDLTAAVFVRSKPSASFPEFIYQP